jgi:hypothetical protein
LDGRRVPPYTIWEGDLEPGGEMVLLTPTIWEWGPGAGVWDGWLAWLEQTLDKYGQRAKELIAKASPNGGPVFDAASLGVEILGTLPGLWSPGGQSMRRPIGLQRDPGNPNGAKFNPTTIALDADTAAQLAGSNDQGLGNGIREIVYKDDDQLRGVYSIFVQIEQLGGQPSGHPDGSVVREISRPDVYVIFGNAKFAIPDPPTLSRLYGGWGAVQVVPDGNLAGTDTVADDGTLLREENSPYVWVMEAGAKRHVTSPAVLARYGGWGLVRAVPDHALALLPLGTPVI